MHFGRDELNYNEWQQQQKEGGFCHSLISFGLFKKEKEIPNLKYSI